MSTNKGTLTILSDREVQMSRVFNAPRELVFRAHTDAALVSQWWGMGNSTRVDKLELQVGGQWRFVQSSPDGNEYAFRGEYREITPPERLVNTFEFEGMPGHILVETHVFKELENGQTKLISTSVFDSKEDRDGMLESGMEHGSEVSWSHLDALLAKQQA